MKAFEDIIAPRRKGMRHVVFALATSIALFAAINPLSAHHAIAAKFDPNKPVTLRGFVNEIDWANPHVHVFIDVQDATSVTSWAIELESPIDLQRSGWSRTTLKPGDGITVQGISARDGSRQAWGNSIVVTSTSKRIFTLSSAEPRRDNPSARPAPRWPDGQPRLGPPPGERGYWGKPSSTALIQAGANVQTDGDGLLRNIADVDKVAPFQRWARDLYELRQRNFLKDDPMFLFCMPPGGPRQFQLPYGIQFLEERDRKRIFVLIGGGNHNWRLIYTDGRAEDPLDKDFPVYYGRSLGRWEGNTLIVDTKNFNERFWFTNGGLPHSDQLHLIERLSRPDFAWTLQWVSGEELPPYYCQDNRP
ncbi:MAG: hypothetical protein DMG13_01445 [Acidobacteria bacterium]|nr:MAG: hypothetical protein DMG13_01445 [Acidobacteriota bacterium]